MLNILIRNLPKFCKFCLIRKGWIPDNNFINWIRIRYDLAGGIRIRKIVYNPRKLKLAINESSSLRA